MCRCFPPYSGAAEKMDVARLPEAVVEAILVFLPQQVLLSRTQDWRATMCRKQQEETILAAEYGAPNEPHE